MIRITALTVDTDSSSSSSDEDDTLVTQEAQETIALSEYMRALRLKNEGNVQVAESLFGELLETKVLYEATKDAKDHKLFHVKFSCLKNLGLICAERGDKKEAIEYWLKASELDDKDVALMNRLGKLALDMDQLDIAQMAFETCLRHNPNHWPAADGMLRMLCEREDFAEAYGWALEWYLRNPKYKYGLDVILEIREKFTLFGGLAFIEGLWKSKFVDTHLKRTNLESVFPKYIMPEPAQRETPDDFNQFLLNEDNLSWLSVGKLVVDMYDNWKDSSHLGYDMSLDEWLGRNVAPANSGESSKSCDEQDVCAVDGSSSASKQPLETGTDEYGGGGGGSKENSSSNTTTEPTTLTTGSSAVNFVAPPFVLATSTDNNPNSTEVVSATEESSDGAAAPKPKVARRRGGGDLIGLEQWGWHRNKRYSQRKKSIDKTDPDSTVNGMLRKALGKFYEEQFDVNISPFHLCRQINGVDNPSTNTTTPTVAAAAAASSSSSSSSEIAEIEIKDFQLATQDAFVEFMTELKDRPYFDVTVLSRTWCKYIGRYWAQTIPVELCSIFKQLYINHLSHFDIETWHHLERSDFQSVFRMTLFYLELVHDQASRRDKDGYKNEVDEDWRKLLYHLIFFAGYFEPDAETETAFMQYSIRWHWLKYLQSRYENDLELAVDYLYAIGFMMPADMSPISLPNLTRNNRIDLPTIDTLKITLERSIRLSTIRQLYREEKFTEMVPILVESLQSLDWTEDPIILADDSSTVLPPTVQFEMLLECFWQLDLPEECLLWSEACLDYSLYHFLKAPRDTHRQTRWGESVTFVLRYLVGLFAVETAAVVEQMGRFGSRLVRNIIRVVVHQLDSPYDKNHNPPHAIDLKLPWILLHKLIERDEDIQYAIKRRAAYAEQQKSSSELQSAPFYYVPDEIPLSTMLFFTVHEFLGLRSWCTQNNGEILLYTMDLVADRLRTPTMDRYRDVLAEYLEQVTYCLYGYPAKRARARHIEEHDACNIELTWERALQLFDLYRPDTLPEFNSYKNDSISVDMEQLLQRIITLLPAEIDLAPLIEPIQNYITGVSSQLPTTPSAESQAILPSRIQCIHYLLADHYFKNRDLVKSVKYYLLDLATCCDRFDAWAGLALSKASVLETKLNACTAIATNEFLSQCEESLRCFQQCFRLDDGQVPLWIEYGNFAYIMHSFCSRSLKQASDTLSMERFEFLETNKEQCLKIAADCFTTVNTHTTNNASATPASNSQPADALPTDSSSQAPPTGASSDLPFPSSSAANINSKATVATSSLTNGTTHDDSHDEKWLYHYMLGKVAEKRKDPPEEVIDHYIESAKCLYEHNASFPFKISHSNPQHLSVEALEVYYRITATIVKFLEQHATVPRAIGRMFIRVLRQVNASPFALNQAKIDDYSINALKRKINQSVASSSSEMPQAKKPREDSTVATTTTNDASAPPSELLCQEAAATSSKDNPNNMETVTTVGGALVTNSPSHAVVAAESEVVPKESNPNLIILDGARNIEETQSPSRRGSQESNMTTTTTGTTTATTTTGTSDTSSSSSSDSSSSESVSSDDSDEDSTDDEAKSADTPLSENELESIYKTCIKNLEECVTRFPEHYKSIYRLVNIYLHAAPERIRDLKRCKQLLLGTYTTGLGNQVQGLFVDRKLNNFFNGIWRIPSTEIDRPGSFAAHLSKCTIVLMEVLRLSADHKVLLELALQLQRNPDSDKRYIKDSERRELFQQAISFCTQSFRQLLKEHGVDRRNDGELILLLLDTYKAHKKYLKYTSHKECPFAILLSDAYRVYLEGKLSNARLPDQFNATEYAIRFCQHEIGLRKNLAKNGGALPAPAQPESFLPAHVLRSIIMVATTTPTSSNSTQLAVPSITTTTSSIISPDAAGSSSATSALALVSTAATTATTTMSVVPETITTVTTATSVASIQITTTAGSKTLVADPVTTSAPSATDSIVNLSTTTSAGAASAAYIPSIRVATTSIIAPPTSSSSLITSMSLNPSVTSSITTTMATPSPATPRPRGRPPGSKNSTPTAASLAANNSNNSSSPFGKLDPATLAAIMGIYSNPSMLPPPPAMTPQYTSDPSVTAALLAEYYKLTNLSGISSLLAAAAGSNNPTSMSLPTSSNAGRFSSIPPSTSTTPTTTNHASSTKLPMFDINSLISSAAEKMNPLPTSAMSPSTVISIGSGQLTITPSTVQPQQQQQQSSSSRSTSKSHKRSYSSLDGMATQSASSSLQMFPDVPSSISMTKVKQQPSNNNTKQHQQQTSLLKSNINLPKDLPKSLTITPAPPIGLATSQTSSSSPSSSSSKYPTTSMQQYPQVTMQQPKQEQPPSIMYAHQKLKQQQQPLKQPQGRSKKTKPQQLQHNLQSAHNLQTQNNLAFNPFSGPIPSSSYLSSSSTATSSNTSSPFFSSAAAADYNNQMAVMSQYADLLKNIDPVHASKMFAQFEQYSKLIKPSTSSSSSKSSKNNHYSTATAATTTSTSSSSSSTTTKGRLSVKQLQSMQHQQISPGLQQQQQQQQSNQQQHSTSHRKQSSSSKQSSSNQQQFTMPIDLLHSAARAMTSPFANIIPPMGSPSPSSSSVLPANAHSPLKSPVLPPPPTSPHSSSAHGGGQISPSKTLQQILADRQKALSSANIQQQMQQQQRSDSVAGNAGAAASISGGNKASLKSDSIIILD